jgi:hypothetical protein
MARRAFTMYHLQKEKDEDWRIEKIEDMFRQLAVICGDIYDSLESVGINPQQTIQAVQSRVKGSVNVNVQFAAQNYSVAGESGIIAGKLITRVIKDSNTGLAYLAKSTDLTRFATDVVTNIGDYVESVPLAAYGIQVFCLSTTATTTDDPTLFLSTTPGFATRNAAETGALFRQQVGYMTGAIGGDGKCTAAIACVPRILL